MRHTPQLRRSRQLAMLPVSSGIGAGLASCQDTSDSSKTGPEFSALLAGANMAVPAGIAPCGGRGIALNFAGAEGKDPDGWYELVPAGRIQGRDGRWWINDNPRAVAAHLTARRPIDINHATILKASKGEDAPAFGWIEESRVNADGGVEYRLAFNAEGKRRIADGEYAFLSPVFHFAGEAKRVQGLHSVALTNNPNLNDMALNFEQLFGSTTQEEHSVNPELLKLLGLNADASEQQVLDAVQALQQRSEQSIDLNQYAPRSDLDGAVRRAETAEAALNAMQLEQGQSRLKKILDEGVKGRKITPASRGDYERMALQVDASGKVTGVNTKIVDDIEKIVAAAGAIAADVEIPDVDEGNLGANAAEEEVRQKMGMSKDDYYGKKSA